MQKGEGAWGSRIRSGDAGVAAVCQTLFWALGQQQSTKWTTVLAAKNFIRVRGEKQVSCHSTSEVDTLGEKHIGNEDKGGLGNVLLNRAVGESTAEKVMFEQDLKEKKQAM